MHQSVDQFRSNGAIVPFDAIRVRSFFHRLVARGHSESTLAFAGQSLTERIVNLTGPVNIPAPYAVYRVGKSLAITHNTKTVIAFIVAIAQVE